MEGKVFAESRRRAREAFARIVGARPEDVAVVPSVSYGVAVAAGNVDVAAGQNLLLADQFPSNVYAWMQLAERVGATTRHVPRPSPHLYNTAADIDRFLRLWRRPWRRYRWPLGAKDDANGRVGVSPGDGLRAGGRGAGGASGDRPGIPAPAGAGTTKP